MPASWPAIDEVALTEMCHWAVPESLCRSAGRILRQAHQQGQPLRSREIELELEHETYESIKAERGGDWIAPDLIEAYERSRQAL